MNLPLLAFGMFFPRCAGLRVNGSEDGSVVPAPEWFTLYDTCASLQEIWRDGKHQYGGHWHKRTLGEVAKGEDECQSSRVAEDVWESALSHIGGKKNFLLASADEQVMSWMQGEQFQSLYFIGDSLGFQQFRSSRCILEAAGWSRMRVTGFVAQHEKTTLEELWSRGGRSILVSMSWRAWLREVPDLLDASLRNASLNGRVHPSKEIVVVALHAHYNEPSMWLNELKEFKAWVQIKNANIILRGPLPQHFSKPDGTYRGGCTPNSESSDWRRSAFQDVIGTSMPVLHVFDFIHPMHFAHARNHGDCTHYCLPVHHVINAALAALLSCRHQ